jgi:hypothetical protein
VAAATLASVQTFLASAVRRVAPLPSDPEIAAREVDRIVAPGPTGMTPIERLEVYREQFWYRHLASLAEDYPTVAWLLGGRHPLDALVTAYLVAHPPSTWNLQRLGERLPSYVATTLPWRDEPAVAAAASLDWAHVFAFDAPDATPFDARMLAGAPADSLPRATITFHPSLQLLSLGHAVRATRQALVREESPAPPEPGPAFVAVWRDATHHVRDADVEPDAHALHAMLHAGRTLGDACEALANALGPERAVHLEDKVGEWFQEWTTRGFITAVRFDP